MDKYNKIKSIFEKNQNKDQAVSMSSYMKNKFIFYGIPSPLRKELYKEFIKEEKKNRIIDWDFLDMCYEDEHREFHYLVCDYLLAFQKQLKYENIERIMKYVNNKQWWDTIDFLDRIIGNIGLKDSRVDTLMLDFSVSDDIWKKRLSIDHQNGRKENTNIELLEKIICNNFGTDEFFINKAIGWSLRDYSKVNPKWVKLFLKKYNSKINNLSIREASKYL